MTTPIGAVAFRVWLIPTLCLLVLASAWVGVRWYRTEHASSLGAVPLFGSLAARQLRVIARSVVRQDARETQALVSEGERVDGLFLLERGTAAVSAGGQQLEVLGPGGYFGELALIDGTPRTATITALTEVRVLRLRSSAFARLVERDPAIADGVAAELRRRLRGAGAPSRPAQPGSADWDDLVRLCRQLRTLGSVDWGMPPAVRTRSWFDRAG